MSDEGGWVLISLDEKMARRQGVPPQIPVPKPEFEGLGAKGVQLDQVKKWITAFLSAAGSPWRTQNGAMASRYDAFIAKVDQWTKAQASFAKGDFKTAISALKLISNIDKEDHAARLNLGSALGNTGDHAGALKHFEAVRETFAGDPDYHVAFAQVLVALQRKDDAVGELVLALEAQPDCHAALETLKALGVLVAIYEDPRDANSLNYVRADSVADH